MAGILASALLLALYARGGHAWPLGFVALTPWLLSLDAERSLRGVLLSGLLMCAGFVIAVFAWFGAAFGAYVGVSTLTATAVLLALAPLLQPQILMYALVRHQVGRTHGLLLRGLAAASAWVGCEWLWPKLLGDTLGHGLFPATTLRQFADLGGAAGLTLVLLTANEAIAVAVRRLRSDRRRTLQPLLLAIVLIALVTGYGHWRLQSLQRDADDKAPTMRIGLVQSNIVDYEQLRAERGAYAVIRHVLDTHYAMSEHAVQRQRAEALLWSETVYPTTFGQPKSEDGAALDREIIDFVRHLGVPLVFGTYDLDAAGEYNAAAFIDPASGLLGHYRKTHPFLLTEFVPPWLDSPPLRRWLPWTGSWQPGHGARVMPLRTADGRELNVVPLICLDDVHSDLAIAGARLGAQAILGLSNDAWFTEHAVGAELHLAVAAFRSIETRMPQLRATSNGISAIIDPYGAVVARTDIGQQAVLVGEFPQRDPPLTLMRAWGDWVGGAALALLSILALHGIAAGLSAPGKAAAQAASPAAFTAHAVDVVLLSPSARVASALLRLLAASGLLMVAVRMALSDGFQVNSLHQISLFAATVLAPALAAWALQRAGAARAQIEGSHLLLEQAQRRIEIPLREISAVHPWRVPLPGFGVDLQLAAGQRWRYGLRLGDPAALRAALHAAGSPAAWPDCRAERIATFAAARANAKHRWLDHPAIKFALFPLLTALPAFRLHQHIAYGGTFGEYYTYGLSAWLTGLGIWWAAWVIGLMLYAAVLRVAIETAALAESARTAGGSVAMRSTLEWLGRGAFYLGAPGWLVVKIVWG